MNCHDFEIIAADLAREGLMDAGQREGALAHTTSCESCRSRLGDERALTDGLRSVAKDANQEAPPRVEAALLAAFRKQQPAHPASAPPRFAKRQWLYVAAAAAAVVVIVAMLALVASRTQKSQQPVEQKAGTVVPRAPEESAPAHPPANPEPKVATVDTERQSKRANRPRRASRTAEHLNEPTATAEIATDFIPLMNRETLAEMDGGQVMRVELPRSALMSFGLPMDMERATERIKADVVVGNDGLARAIRFVR
jgi:hypothetical protein